MKTCLILLACWISPVGAGGAEKCLINCGLIAQGCTDQTPGACEKKIFDCRLSLCSDNIRNCRQDCAQMMRGCKKRDPVCFGFAAETPGFGTCVRGCHVAKPCAKECNAKGHKNCQSKYQTEADDCYEARTLCIKTCFDRHYGA